MFKLCVTVDITGQILDSLYILDRSIISHYLYADPILFFGSFDFFFFYQPHHYDKCH